MKLRDITNPNFDKALAELNGKALPIKAAFKLKDIVKKVAAELEKFNEVRSATLKKYATKDAAGEPVVENNTFKLEGENLQGFVKDFEDLIDSDIADVGSLTVAELGDKVELSCGDLLALDAILKS